MKRGDLVRTNPESWSYKVWTGVVLKISNGSRFDITDPASKTWVLVHCTEGGLNGKHKQWIPVAVLEVV
jgi:hypothetical protein